MAGRSTRSNTANNTNPPNETSDEVTRQLNTALPNLLSQLFQVLRGTEQIKERSHKASVLKHSGLLVPRNSLAQKDLAPEIKPHVTSSKSTSIQSAVSMANHFTIDGIKDGIFKKQENARNKKSFISTNFLPLINMKPIIISFSYEIEIASGLKVVTNMIVRGCRLELEGHTFVIYLVPFGHGSFDVIVRMDWLSKLRAKIVCYEKIVQILLSNGKNLEVQIEHPEGNLKQLKTMTVNEQKLEDILVIREFPGVFLEDLSGLPPSREVFHVDLIPGAMPVAKLPYRLAPTKMKELSNQLKDL
nr:putative reverse transcriptase domain-containing protein [Tanacetum cinerariifolium]